MDNICQQILPINNTRLRGIDLSLDSTCHEVLMLWMTNARHWFIMRTLHVIDQSPFSMLYIYNTCSTYYQSIHWSYMAHSDLGKMYVRAKFVDISRLQVHLPWTTTLFTSSDIILSRTLPPTNKDIGNQQFVDFDLVDHDRTWWGYIDHHENWWSDVCWNDGVTLILHSAVIPALEPTSCAATTLLSGSDIISLLIHRCSPAPI